MRYGELVRKQAKSGFLSRVPHLEAEANRWLENWPLRTRDVLRRRVSSSNTDDVYPALLELYVHEMLRHRFLGVCYEPTLPNTPNHPEFLARDGRESIIVECKVVFDEECIRVSNREITRLVNVVNTIQSDYGISIQPEGRLRRAIIPRRIGAFLRRELPRLPRPIQLGTSLVFSDPPTGTRVTFELLGPNDPGANPVWTWWPSGERAEEVTTHERILSAVDEKATKYGELAEPFLVVIWPLTEFPPISPVILRALYGDDQLQINPLTRSVVGRTRSANGAFTRVSKEGAALCSRVSAVGIYHLHLDSQDTHEHRFAIFHNPHAGHVLNPSLFDRVPHFAVQTHNDQVTTLGWRDGARPHWWD